MLDELMARLSQTKAGQTADAMLSPHAVTFERAAQRQYERWNSLPQSPSIEDRRTRLPMPWDYLPHLTSETLMQAARRPFTPTPQWFDSHERTPLGILGGLDDISVPKK